MLSYSLGVGCLDVGSLGGCSRGNVLARGMSVVGGACSGPGCCCSCFTIGAAAAVWCCVVEANSVEGASGIGVSVMCVFSVGEGVNDDAVPILPGDSCRGIVAVAATTRCPS